MTYVLDTDTFSLLMRGDAGPVHRFSELSPSEVFIPQPVIAEVYYGLSRLPRSRRREELERRADGLFAVLLRAEWSDGVSQLFGSLKADLEKRGERLDDFDVAIAAHALALGATLVTRNVRHLGRVKGLVVEDWSVDA